MNSEPNIKELFEKWNSYNEEVQESIGGFDLTNVKKIREKQQELEDKIYNLLRENSPSDYLQMLPQDCGELEIGYDTSNNEFYFVMIDPITENSDDIKLIAFTIDVNKSVKKLDDFIIED